jgi:hypothetical protein
MMPPAIREAHAAMLERLASDVALTLVYNDTPISRERIRRDLKSLRNKVDRILLGGRYYKRQPHERSQFWAVVELLDEYPHVHIGWRLPPSYGIDDLAKILAGGLWLTFAHRGEYNIQEYRYGWAAYATKALTNSHSIVESADFLR